MGTGNTTALRGGVGRPLRRWGIPWKNFPAAPHFSKTIGGKAYCPARCSVFHRHLPIGGKFRMVIRSLSLVLVPAGKNGGFFSSLYIKKTAASRFPSPPLPYFRKYGGLCLYWASLLCPVFSGGLNKKAGPHRFSVRPCGLMMKKLDQIILPDRAEPHRE